MERCLERPVTATPVAVASELRVFTDRQGSGGALVRVHHTEPGVDLPQELGSTDLYLHEGGRSADLLDALGRPSLALTGLLAAVDLLADPSTMARFAVNGRTVVGWREGKLVWVRIAPPEPHVVLEQRPTPGELGRLRPVADPGAGRFVWAWVDADSGLVRARLFPSTYEVEDEANPDGAVELQRRQPRPLTVRQGHASVLFTRPAPAGKVEIGGRVARA